MGIYQLTLSACRSLLSWLVVYRFFLQMCASIRVSTKWYQGAKRLIQGAAKRYMQRCQGAKRLPQGAPKGAPHLRLRGVASICRFLSPLPLDGQCQVAPVELGVTEVQIVGLADRFIQAPVSAAGRSFESVQTRAIVVIANKCPRRRRDPVSNAIGAD
jgi:hypothetical protein